jgi:NifB/MoaA-like Fe-S oxidoreductase
MRRHTVAEACAVVDTVEEWQHLCLEATGRRLVFAADEYYLLAGRPFPAAAAYEGFPQHENGIGMARAFEAAYHGDLSAAHGVQPGFFSWVDGAPAAGYRAPRTGTRLSPPQSGAVAGERAPVAILTGEYGAAVLEPLLRDGPPGVRLVPVRNDFFGGNIAVTGLITGTDVARVLRDQPPEERYLLPDVCLSEGRFLDGTTVADLPRPVEVIPSDGYSLRLAIEGPGATAASPVAMPARPVPVGVALRASR